MKTKVNTFNVLYYLYMIWCEDIMLKSVWVGNGSAQLFSVINKMFSAIIVLLSIIVNY